MEKQKNRKLRQKKEVSTKGVGGGIEKNNTTGMRKISTQRGM